MVAPILVYSLGVVEGTLMLSVDCRLFGAGLRSQS